MVVGFHWFTSVICLAVLSTVNGCGPLQTGRAKGSNMVNCVIVSGTVTNICTDSDPNGNMCNDPAMLAMNSRAVPPTHLSISGGLKTSNAIMANWSNQMWQSVLNRVLRMITSTPNGSSFLGASVNIR